MARSYTIGKKPPGWRENVRKAQQNKSKQWRDRIRASVNAHYQKLHGSMADRFWSKVDKRGPDDCWEWKGSKMKGRRYGRFSFIAGGEKHNDGAHRIAYALSNGIAPETLSAITYICHTCDNPPCCNPKHLFNGTAKINMDDAIKKGRIKPKGEGNANSKLTEAQVLEIRRTFRPGVDLLKNFGARYGVSYVMIRDILRRKNWTHI